MTVKITILNLYRLVKCVTAYFCGMYVLKKSLGQHFLIDENIIKKILSALQQDNFNQLLEVGPGAGALTKHLLALPDISFKTVEIDDDKVDYLNKTYPELKDKIIHQDFLKIDSPFVGSFNIIGNFPYNISTQILFKALDWKDQVPLIIGMFQKEVAQRIGAKEGSKIYGVTSVLMQAFYQVEHLFDVSESSFNPPPKVKSSVIRLRRRNDTPEMHSEKKLFTLVKSAFNQRRKTLRNATKHLFDALVLEDVIFNKRPEQLTINEFAALTFKMKEN